ncbi:MAG: hypothetical protein CVT67_06485 [Actinobacteria bacterium HGW-Actinobacteria-7]|jgi:Tol biopolymer transport system component|nr:MAG: hypothetical protein CVT67_06485 [Actinobacteria bacterium HGW-Actinobacteria-7]
MLQVAAVSLAAVLGVALAGWALWAVFIGPKDDTAMQAASIDPAQESTASAVASAPASSPGTGTAAAQPASSSAQPGRATPAFVRAARIAYELDGSVYIAHEDGTNAKKIGHSTSGSYALSPDGGTLAVVSDMRLTLFDVASGAKTEVSSAIDACPVWAPDSTHVLFFRRDTKEYAPSSVWEVERRGSHPVMLCPGDATSVSPNGRSVVVMDSTPVQASDGTTVQLYLSQDSGAFAPMALPPGVVSAVAVSDDRVFVGMLAPQGPASIISVGLDGTGVTPVFGAPSDGSQTTWGVLRLSPDGSRLAAASTGDDGYSRVSILRLGGGAEIRPDSRRDAYPRCWNSNGTYLYYVEGNQFQGEATTLYRVEKDGLGRKALVVGGR